MSQSARFEGLLDRCFETLLHDAPPHAAVMGIRSAEGKLGRLNARLHQRLVVGRSWKLRRFNDWLLSFGTLPQAWIEKYGLD